MPLLLGRRSRSRLDAPAKRRERRAPGQGRSPEISPDFVWSRFLLRGFSLDRESGARYSRADFKSISRMIPARPWDGGSRPLTLSRPRRAAAKHVPGKRESHARGGGGDPDFRNG